MKFSPLLAALLFAWSFTVGAVPPEIDPAKELPRFPAVEPKDAVPTFRVKPGFHLEIAAAEPLVTDPIALCFDENGRCFAVQMTDYSERREEQPHLGSIKLLEDTDGDGRLDRGTTYVSDLPWPTAVFPWDGGIFVIATPDLFYCKDTNGDGRADIRNVIYTGFGNTKDRLNVQGLANSLQWGLDNRIHGQTAPNGGILTNRMRASDRPLNCDNRNFSFNPHTWQMFPESGGGQYGMSFTTRGKKLASSNSEHLMMFMCEARYADRNPYFAMPKALVNIAADGGAAEVFRASPEEPWRVIRTQWRVSGVSKGIVEGGGRASGYFTGASAVSVYRGSAFPADFLDNAFTGDAGGNLVHRKVLVPDDVGYQGRRPADEQKTEFLASSDTWFRPTQSFNAPDGCFYVADMYREVIEHPWSLPEQLKKHIDLNSGNDRGRIYRIVPDGFKQPKLPRLGKMKTAELVATLEHPNGWHRETAARLLYERQDPAAVKALTKLVEKSPSPLGRMHALYALDGLRALTEKSILHGLQDDDERVREHAVKLSEKVLNQGRPSAALWAQLRNRASDPALLVVYQAAFTFGEMPNNPERNQALAQCVQRDGRSAWMQAAVLSSLSQGAGEVFAILSRDAKFAAEVHGKEFLGKLAAIIGTKNDATEVNAVLQFVGAEPDATASFGLLRSLGEGLQRAKSSLWQAASSGNLRAIMARAGEVAAQKNAPPALRTQAIQLLGSARFADASPILFTLLHLPQPSEIQLAAINTLGKFPDQSVSGELIQRWNSFSPQIKHETLAILLARPERALELLVAVQNGTIPRTELATTQVKFLREHRHAEVKAKALAIFGQEAASQRQVVVDAFLSATSLSGDATHGKSIYAERCASCHRLEGAGFVLGPDLVTVQSGGKEKMLVSILDPNREVAPQYQAYEVETKDDESYLGLIASETATSVTLRQAFGKEDTILRSNIKKTQSQQQTLMPEGLEMGLTPQDMADLLEYITTAK